MTAIAANARRYPVSAQCRILGVPRSTCYRMLANPPRPKPPDPIGPDVLGAFEASRGGYGARRLKVALERSGVVAPRRRICRITRDNGLSSAYPGRAPKGGARPAWPPSAGNVLARAFDGHAPRTHVASDLAYVRAEGLAKILAKGMKIALEGKIRWSQWEHECQKRSKIDVIADEIELMSRRGTDAVADEAPIDNPLAPEDILF